MPEEKQIKIPDIISLNQGIQAKLRAMLRRHQNELTAECETIALTIGIDLKKYSFNTQSLSFQLIKGRGKPEKKEPDNGDNK